MNITKNPTLKHRNRNERFQELLTENFKLLAVVALTLNKALPDVFYPKRLQDWFERLTETAKMFNESDRDGAFEYDVKRLMDAPVGFTFSDCVTAAKYHLGRSTGRMSAVFLRDDKIVEVLARNIQGALLQTHYDYRIGEKRMKRIVQTLKTDWYIDPAAELDARFGIDASYTLTDSDSERFFKKDKLHTTVSEQIEARQGLEALRAYQNAILQEEENYE